MASLCSHRTCRSSLYLDSCRDWRLTATSWWCIFWVGNSIIPFDLPLQLVCLHWQSIIVLEYLRPSMRTLGLNLCIGIFYCLGSMVTPWIAVWLGSWKLYLIYTSLPIAIVPLFYFILPESAQWLISKNDIEGAIVCYRRVARFNGRVLDNDTIESFRAHHRNQMQKQAEADYSGPGLLGLFKTPRLRRNTLILFFKS